MSFSMILSAAIDGLKVEFIHAEADVSNGLPVFHMVGYLASEVKEAGERVRTAIRNSGFEYPAKRTVINLSPATIRKRGASFDLPIAAAILTSLGQIPPGSMRNCLMIGELSLNGHVRKVPGILPVVMEAAEKGITRCIVPKENEAEGRLVSGIEVTGVKSLRETVSFLRDGAIPGEERQTGKERKTRKRDDGSDMMNEGGESVTEELPDFSELQGQENVRRAAEIAVAGGHNLFRLVRRKQTGPQIGKRTGFLHPGCALYVGRETGKRNPGKRHILKSEPGLLTIQRLFSNMCRRVHNSPPCCS